MTSQDLIKSESNVPASLHDELKSKEQALEAER